MLLFWVVGKLAPLFALLALGFLSGRRLGVDEQTLRDLGRRGRATWLRAGADLPRGDLRLERVQPTPPADTASRLAHASRREPAPARKY
ncbi:MAG: hypothetical protein ABGW95_01545 [Candidatus Poseidoniia archaeon]